VTGQTPEEEAGEREEDDRNAGCFLDGLWIAGEGCLWAAIPCVAAFIWVLS
jgi:hypothetical protein